MQAEKTMFKGIFHPEISTDTCSSYPLLHHFKRTHCKKASKWFELVKKENTEFYVKCYYSTVPTECADIKAR